MPYIDIKIASMAADDEFDRLAATLSAALTELTGNLLKKKRELTAVSVQRVAPGHWFIAGAPVAASFYAAIKVTQGTNTKDEKAAWLSAVYAAFERVLGPLNPASYAVIHEVPADSWGYGGATQERRYIQASAL